MKIQIGINTQTSKIPKVYEKILQPLGTKDRNHHMISPAWWPLRALDITWYHLISPEGRSFLKKKQNKQWISWNELTWHPKKGHQHNGRHWLPNIEAQDHKLTNTSKLFLYIRKKSLNKLWNKTQSSFVYSQHKKGLASTFWDKTFFQHSFKNASVKPNMNLTCWKVSRKLGNDIYQ